MGRGERESLSPADLDLGAVQGKVKENRAKSNWQEGSEPGLMKCYRFLTTEKRLTHARFCSMSLLLWDWTPCFQHKFG
jgi:hypothetical protein